MQLPIPYRLNANAHTFLRQRLASLSLALSLCLLSTSPLALSEAVPASSTLLSVPPSGLESMTEADLAYYQNMGPLEYAVRALPLPSYPTWRLSLALYPVMAQQQEGVLAGYRVVAEQINLSNLRYESVKADYGNADESLRNSQPSQRYTLPFLIVQNVSAELMADEISLELFEPQGEACGLQPNCSALWQDNAGEWGQEQALPLAFAPWDKTDPKALVDQPQGFHQKVAQVTRSLAQQAGWLQRTGEVWQWTTPEIPEGLTATRPWVNLTIDNYAGNGGMWVADWVETVADDSIAKQVERVIVAEDAPPLEDAVIMEAVVCTRGKEPTTVQQTCL